MKHRHLVVIGGGVIGLATAYELAKREHKVTILEKGRCGGQATGAAAGMLAPYSEIAEDPDDFFALCHHSLGLYPEWQAELKQISGLDFEYNPSGSLYTVFHEADILTLETRIEWQQKWGVQGEIIQGASLHKLEPSLTAEAVAALYYPQEHHLYAPDYVHALRQACQRLGVEILEEAGEVHLQEVRDAGGVQLSTTHLGDYFAEQCIISSGAWSAFFEQEVKVRLPIFPIRGQICAYRQEVEQVGHMVFSSQGYVVAKGNGTLVCGASEDIAGYDNSVTDKGIKRLIKWSSRLFPFLAEREPFHRWAGLRPATQDGFPLIGRLVHSPSVIVDSGHYRNGILLSPINAKIVADIVEGKQPQWNIEAFNPMRFQ